MNSLMMHLSRHKVTYFIVAVLIAVGFVFANQSVPNFDNVNNALTGNAGAIAAKGSVNFTNDGVAVRVASQNQSISWDSPHSRATIYLVDAKGDDKPVKLATVSGNEAEVKMPRNVKEGVYSFGIASNRQLALSSVFAVVKSVQSNVAADLAVTAAETNLEFKERGLVKVQEDVKRVEKKVDEVVKAQEDTVKRIASVEQDVARQEAEVAVFQEEVKSAVSAALAEVKSIQAELQEEAAVVASVEDQQNIDASVKELAAAEAKLAEAESIEAQLAVTEEVKVAIVAAEAAVEAYRNLVKVADKVNFSGKEAYEVAVAIGDEKSQVKIREGVAEALAMLEKAEVAVKDLSVNGKELVKLTEETVRMGTNEAYDRLAVSVKELQGVTADAVKLQEEVKVAVVTFLEDVSELTATMTLVLNEAQEAELQPGKTAEAGLNLGDTAEANFVAGETQEADIQLGEVAEASLQLSEPVVVTLVLNEAQAAEVSLSEAKEAAVSAETADEIASRQVVAVAEVAAIAAAEAEAVAKVYESVEATGATLQQASEVYRSVAVKSADVDAVTDEVAKTVRVTQEAARIKEEVKAVSAELTTVNAQAAELADVKVKQDVAVRVADSELREVKSDLTVYEGELKTDATLIRVAETDGAAAMQQQANVIHQATTTQAQQQANVVHQATTTQGTAVTDTSVQWPYETRVTEETVTRGLTQQNSVSAQQQSN